MNHAEFKTIRESIGLSAQFLADLLEVRLRTVQHWEAGRSTIPEDAQETLLDLEGLQDVLCATELEFIQENETPKRVVLLRYQNSADYWHFRPDDNPMPVGFHVRLIAKVRSALKAQGVAVVIEYMIKDEYLSWLDGRPDTEAERSAWACFKNESRSKP